MTTRARHRADRRDRSTRCCRCSSATKWRSCCDGDKFVGLITRIDLINHLRLQRHEPKRDRTACAFATRTIHARPEPDPTTGAVMMPIYATSTYAQESPGVHKGYEYSRSQNPDPLGASSAASPIWKAARGFAFASGLAAIATVLELLDSGAHVVASDDLYGGTFRLFERVRRRSAGLDFSFVDLTDPAAIEAAITPEHEDDLGRDADQSAAEARRSGGDRRARAQAQASSPSPTTPSPAPMCSGRWSIGFDIVMHSTTKYLNGHSDMVGGVRRRRRQSPSSPSG